MNTAEAFKVWYETGKLDDGQIALIPEQDLDRFIHHKLETVDAETWRSPHEHFAAVATVLSFHTFFRSRQPAVKGAENPLNTHLNKYKRSQRLVGRSYVGLSSIGVGVGLTWVVVSFTGTLSVIFGFKVVQEEDPGAQGLTAGAGGADDALGAQFARIEELAKTDPEAAFAELTRSTQHPNEALADMVPMMAERYLAQTIARYHIQGRNVASRRQFVISYSIGIALSTAGGLGLTVGCSFTIPTA